MNVPLIVLAVLSVIGGFLIVPGLYELLGSVTTGMVPHTSGEEGAHHGEAFDAVKALTGAAAWQTYVTLGFVALGAGAAWFGFGPEKFARGWTRAQEKLFSGIQEGYEAVLHAIFARGGTAFSELLYSAVDRQVIDGAVNGTGLVVDYLAESLRTLQTGYVRNYALVMLAGAVFVVACFMFILQRPQWIPMQWVVAIIVALVILAVLSSILVQRREEPIETGPTH